MESSRKKMSLEYGMVSSKESLKVYAAPLMGKTQLTGEEKAAQQEEDNKPVLERLETFCQETWTLFSSLAFQELGTNFLQHLGIEVKVETPKPASELELAKELCNRQNEFKPLITLISEMYTHKPNIDTIKKVTEGTLYKTHKRLSLLFGLLACTMVYNEEIIEILNDFSKRIIDNLLHTYEPKDITFVSLCLFLVYKNIKEEEELLQDAFILANYANIIDPLGAEILMVTIGEKIIKKYQSYPSLFDSQFVEFVSRRTSTSNTGRMNKDSLHFFSTFFLNNHNTNNRPCMIENPCEFTEHLKCVSDKPSKYYAEDLYRFKSTKNIEHCYKAMESVYSEKNTQFHDRACKLANIYHIAQCLELSSKLYLNERLILLLNSVHNFHVASISKKKVIDSSNWELSGNKFNVDAFTKTVFNLYNLLLNNQDEIEDVLPSAFSELNIHEIFPKLLIKQLTLSLYEIACTLDNDIKENEIQENKKLKSNSVMVLKERCFNGIVSNINQFLDIISPGRKFDDKLKPIHQFVEKHNMRFKLIFEFEPTLDKL